MTKIQRIRNVAAALLMLLCCFVLISDPENGFYFVALILMVSMLVYAVRCLLFYFTMARHMVGGRSMLYKGIIVLDLSIFTLSMVDDPQFFIVLYLLVIHAFAGVLDILRALEARRYQAPAWRRSLVSGVGNLVIADLALVNGIIFHSTKDLVYIYAACLFYSACVQLVTAFRKTAIVYIQ